MSSDAEAVDAPMVDPFSSNAGAAEVEGGHAVGEELIRLAEQHESLVLVAADLGDSPMSSAFVRRFPDRFFDFGIAETNSMSAAAGLMMGYFGTSHHAVEDIAIARAITGLTVVAPSDANSMRALLRSTVDHPAPVFFRIGTGEERPVHDEVPVVERGRFVSLRSGADLAIIATGLGVQAAMRAAEQLSAEGVQAQVYDALYLKPLDEQAVLEAAQSTGRILTVEEHKPIGGLGSAVGEVLLRNRVPVEGDVMALPDEDLLVGVPRALLKHYGITADGVVERARALMAR